MGQTGNSWWTTCTVTQALLPAETNCRTPPPKRRLFGRCNLSARPAAPGVNLHNSEGRVVKIDTATVSYRLLVFTQDALHTNRHYTVHCATPALCGCIAHPNKSLGLQGTNIMLESQHKTPAHEGDSTSRATVVRSTTSLTLPHPCRISPFQLQVCLQHRINSACTLNRVAQPSVTA
jgi:hypothetical protein